MIVVTAGDDMNEKVDMSVSPVFGKDGKKYAFVSFQDGTRYAEGKIPDCIITSSKGFTDDETGQLEEYMRQNLATLKRMAAGVNVMSAFMKD